MDGLQYLGNPLPGTYKYKERGKDRTEDQVMTYVSFIMTL